MTATSTTRVESAGEWYNTVLTPLVPCAMPVQIAQQEDAIKRTYHRKKSAMWTGSKRGHTCASKSCVCFSGRSRCPTKGCKCLAGHGPGGRYCSCLGCSKGDYEGREAFLIRVEAMRGITKW